jgi:hypothetical protein
MEKDEGNRLQNRSRAGWLTLNRSPQTCRIVV